MAAKLKTIQISSEVYDAVRNFCDDHGVKLKWFTEESLKGDLPPDYKPQQRKSNGKK